MLLYIYRNRGKLIKKEELYYKGYLDLNHIPQPEDQVYEAPTLYQSILDTNLYRLRKVIEPDPANPVIIQRVHGHGVRLK